MNTNLEHPYNRRQMFLGGIADITDDIPDTRYDRDELYYAAIYNRVKGMDEDIDVLERKVEAMATDMKYKGSVEDYEHLPTNAKKGDVYTTLDDGREYVYDGDQWVEISFKIDVVQGTGQSTTDVMSQKAVTDALPAIVDNLNSTSTTAALSANQGKVLKGLIDDAVGNIDTLLANLISGGGAE